MTHILRIDSSPRDAASKSRDLTALTVEQLSDGDTTVTHRDIDEGLPFVGQDWIGGAYTDPSERSPEQKAALELSDELIAELKAADILVMGIPMYNFTVPASVKAYFDQVARVGVTFKYTEQGPKGLLENKRAIVLVATGGVPVGSDADYLTPYVRHFLGFLGITDVEFHAADGLNGPDAEKSIKEAKAEIRELEPA